MSEPAEVSAGSPGAGQEHTEDAEISLLDLLIVLAERKRIVLWVTVAFAVAGIIVSFVLPVRYTAMVTLLPPQEGSSMAAALSSQLGSLGGMAALAGGGLGLKNPNDRYVAMLQSRTVEDAMVEKFGLMKEYHRHYLSDARKDFESHTTVDGNGKDGLIHISFEDHHAARAAEIANGYVDQFRDLSQHLAITEASQRRLFFQQELEKAKNNLATAEEALEQTELTTGVIQPDSQERALIESAASLRAQITAREVQIQGMQTYATGENSELVQAQQELAGLRAQLAKLGGSEDSSGNEFLIPKGLVPKAGMEYVRRLRDVKYYETIFDILARQFEMAKLDEAKEGALIQVVDPAIVPDKRSFPKRSLIVIGMTAAGFIFGMIFVLLQAGLQRLKSNPDESGKLDLLRRALSGRSATVSK
ncbi:MAG: Wzz/FepE/Etk N-terminal domain-containing protein [Acidobacteriaceae bacterium]